MAAPGTAVGTNCSPRVLYEHFATRRKSLGAVRAEKTPGLTDKRPKSDELLRNVGRKRAKNLSAKKCVRKIIIITFLNGFYAIHFWVNFMKRGETVVCVG